MLPGAAASSVGAAAARSQQQQQQQRRAAASSASSSSPPTARKPAGYVWHELMFWHNPGDVGDLATRVQPTRHHEHAETKRRLHNLVELSGLLSAPAPAGGRQGAVGGAALVELEPRRATIAELER